MSQTENPLTLLQSLKREKLRLRKGLYFSSSNPCQKGLMDTVGSVTRHAHNEQTICDPLNTCPKLRALNHLIIPYNRQKCQ